jgi:hypothetical protein
MRTGHCPHCCMHTIRRYTRFGPASSSSTMLDLAQTATHIDRIIPTVVDSKAIPAPFGPAEVVLYQCDLCGYSEEWIESASDLDKIRILASNWTNNFWPSSKQQ